MIVDGPIRSCTLICAWICACSTQHKLTKRNPAGRLARGDTFCDNHFELPARAALAPRPVGPAGAAAGAAAVTCGGGGGGAAAAAAATCGAAGGGATATCGAGVAGGADSAAVAAPPLLLLRWCCYCRCCQSHTTAG